MSDFDIEYQNEFRRDPLVLDKYIYVVVESGHLTYRILDSFYTYEDAEAKQKTLMAKNPHNDFTIHKSRLYR